MKVFLGADHGGFTLKEKIKAWLKEHDFDVKDLGPEDDESCDYPLFAIKVARAVAEDEDFRGILICGTGLGMSMAANKIPGIRAACCHDAFTTEMARRHNNANILCLGARNTDHDLALKLVDIFLHAEFDGFTPEGERHKRRMDAIAELDKR